MQTISLNSPKEIEQISKKYDVVLVTLPIYSEDISIPYKEEERNKNSARILKSIIEHSFDIITDDGLLFIYGSPIQLLNSYEHLKEKSIFRYWIASEVRELVDTTNLSLKKSHLGILMLSKGKNYLSLNTSDTRIPYHACSYCQKNIRDWGGKKHLMNKNGTGLSDVWKNFFKVIKTVKDEYRPDITLNIVDGSKNSITFNPNKIPKEFRDRINQLVESEKRRVVEIAIPSSVLPVLVQNHNNLSFVEATTPSRFLKTNQIELGDTITLMENLLKEYPNGAFDLVFADPPYNLAKDYKLYEDDLRNDEYLKWCDKWLELCIKLTKPTGNVLILNIPKWSLFHAVTLSKIGYFQNWIVWDALSTPKGKLMPAHYALLHFTKSKSGFTFNTPLPIDSPEYCLRSSCIKSRKRGFDIQFDNIPNITQKCVPVSDIWSDIPRIKHQKDRDEHPCQLPDKLMDRIIQTFSKEGDIVFDPFAGAGTTAIRAMVNKRDFFTTEIDPFYFDITSKKINQVNQTGSVIKPKAREKAKSLYTKRGLELNVQSLARKYKRKPTLEEFIKAYNLDVEQIEILYGNANDVMKAARISLINRFSK